MTNPKPYTGIPDNLGPEIEEQILTLEPYLAGPSPAGEDYLERVGRLAMARAMATEKVLAELVYLPVDPDPSSPLINESGAWTGPDPETSGWEPTLVIGYEVPPD